MPLVAVYGTLRKGGRLHESYLNNARVTVKGTSLEAFTDSSGEYVLARVPAGPVEVAAAFTGLAGNLNTNLTFFLASSGDVLIDNVALVAALERWPAEGVPDRPGAWLMTTAKRRALDALRQSALHARKEGEYGQDLATLGADNLQPPYAPDGSAFAAVAFGVYPALNVADAHIAIVRDGTEYDTLEAVPEVELRSGAAAAAEIVLYRGVSPSGPEKSFNAREVIANLGPGIVRPETR